MRLTRDERPSWQHLDGSDVYNSNGTLCQVISFESGVQRKCENARGVGQLSEASWKRWARNS
jgi:hypothetical protein